MTFLSPPHQQEATQLDLTRDPCQGLGRDELGAHLGQQAFIRIQKPLEKNFGKKQLDNGIAQKLKALVVWLGMLRLIAQAGMSECLVEQGAIVKLMPDSSFEKFHVTRRMEVSSNQASSQIGGHQLNSPEDRGQ